MADVSGGGRYGNAGCFRKHQRFTGRRKRQPSVCRQRPAARAFVARIRFPCAWGAAGETCRETLLRKASEPAAHVAGFGFHLEGFGPPSLPKGVIRRKRLAAAPRGIHAAAADEIGRGWPPLPAFPQKCAPFVDTLRRLRKTAPFLSRAFGRRGGEGVFF